MKSLLEPYFPQITDQQLAKFSRMEELYRDWNQKINVISRKDIEHFRTRHLLHSLSIGRFISFCDGTRIMDIGTGGGFPGLPLAILFPDCEFILVDSIAKKIKVVESVRQDLEILNVSTIIGRSETLVEQVEFITGRAVTNLKEFTARNKRLIAGPQRNDRLNGFLYLTGGEIDPSISEGEGSQTIMDLYNVFDDPYFETKKLVHIAFHNLKPQGKKVRNRS